MALSFDSVYSAVPYAPPSADDCIRFKKEGIKRNELEKINLYIGKGSLELIHDPESYKREFPKKVTQQKSDCTLFPKELAIGDHNLNAIGHPYYKDNMLVYPVVREHDQCPCLVTLTFKNNHIKNAVVSPIPFI